MALTLPASRNGMVFAGRVSFSTGGQTLVTWAAARKSSAPVALASECPTSVRRVLPALPGSGPVVVAGLLPASHHPHARAAEVLVARPAQHVVVPLELPVRLAALGTTRLPNLPTPHVRVPVPVLLDHERRVHLPLPRRDGVQVKQRAVALSEVLVAEDLFAALVAEKAAAPTGANDAKK